jgi:hypothetical protein
VWPCQPLPRQGHACGVTQEDKLLAASRGWVAPGPACQRLEPTSFATKKTVDHRLISPNRYVPDLSRYIRNKVGPRGGGRSKIDHSIPFHSIHSCSAPRVGEPEGGCWHFLASLKLGCHPQHDAKNVVLNKCKCSSRNKYEIRKCTDNTDVAF